MSSKFLTAEWKNLVMANYIIEPEVVNDFLPHKTEIDYYKGNTYISLVGFMFLNTRVKGVKIPFHTNFEEVNLRFYVQYNDNGNWKRGVTFIKEIVPKPAISFVANTVYHEKYQCLSMKNSLVLADDAQMINYEWKHKRINYSMAATTELIPVPMQQGSEEEFIAEHYWGYSKYSEHTTYEYQVAHPKWNIFPVKSFLINCDFGKLYGKKFSFLNTASPNSVFVAEGSGIEVYGKRKI